MIEWPTPLCSTAGAITVTSPSRMQLLAQGPQAGGEHAVVVGQQDLHGSATDPSVEPKPAESAPPGPPSIVTAPGDRRQPTAADSASWSGVDLTFQHDPG